MKKILTLTLTLVILLTSSFCGASLYRTYKRLVKREKIGRIREYWTEDLSAKTLKNRGDDLIIEKIIGVCTNNKKDGKIFTDNKYCDYISYKKIKGVRKGDTILTLLIYQPNSKGVDDIIDRIDYIIDREK